MPRLWLVSSKSNVISIVRIYIMAILFYSSESKSFKTIMFFNIKVTTSNNSYEWWKWHISTIWVTASPTSKAFSTFVNLCLFSSVLCVLFAYVYIRSWNSRRYFVQKNRYLLLKRDDFISMTAFGLQPSISIWNWLILSLTVFSNEA